MLVVDVIVAVAADNDMLVDYNFPAAHRLGRSLDCIVDILVAGIEGNLDLTSVRYGTVGIDSAGMAGQVEKNVPQAERTVLLVGRILPAEYTVCLDRSADLCGGSVGSCDSSLRPGPLGHPPKSQVQT